MAVPLWMYLMVAALLFCIGIYGVLARRNAVAILMAIELMLNAVNINLVAFWRFITPQVMNGQVFAAFVFVVAAAEAAFSTAAATVAVCPPMMRCLLTTRALLDASTDDMSPASYDFAAEPPVLPDENGFYPVPEPGRMDPMKARD